MNQSEQLSRFRPPEKSSALAQLDNFLEPWQQTEDYQIELNELTTENKTLRIGIPSRGELTKGSIQYLSSFGWDTSLLAPETRKLVTDVSQGVTVFKLRAPDIIEALRVGAIDSAILGADIIWEELLNPNPTPLITLQYLKFGGCSFRMGFPLDRDIPSGDKITERLKTGVIATSLPNILTHILSLQGIFLERNRIITLTGSLEAAIQLYPKQVIAVADRVSSGETMMLNGIRADIALWESPGACVVTTENFLNKQLNRA